MGTKDTISGNRKGQVTDKIATKLTNYYADALKTNAPDIKSMQDAVFASLYHMSSTNEEPNHKLCPTGEKSWCCFIAFITHAQYLITKQHYRVLYTMYIRGFI